MTATTSTRRRSLATGQAQESSKFYNAMRNLSLYIFVFLLVGCDRRTDNDSSSRTVSVNACEELSPKDLGILKQRFTASPKSDEVAIFRSRNRSKLEPHQNQTYDQIYWTKGDQVTIDVVLAPLSFYLGYPEPEGGDREQLFRDSWRLRADGYGYDIKEYRFIKSRWSSSSERATGKVVYTKNNVTESEDLVFEFEMFVLPISEARKIHPELEKPESKTEKGTTSWKAAYLLTEDPKQEAGTGQSATRPESKSEGDDEPQPESEERSR